jgi:uncharacterized protein (DUF2236 family)
MAKKKAAKKSGVAAADRATADQVTAAQVGKIRRALLKYLKENNGKAKYDDAVDHVCMTVFGCTEPSMTAGIVDLILAAYAHGLYPPPMIEECLIQRRRYICISPCPTQ